MTDYGHLVPSGGGDVIELRKEKLVIGRRESCDIVLAPATSPDNMRMTLEQGYWFLKDLGSKNGTKVNGYRISRKRLDPGAVISFAKHVFTMDYSPEAFGRVWPTPARR